MTGSPRWCRTSSAPAHLIESALPTEATIAHVLVARYADHCPLYRQAQIHARAGLALTHCWAHARRKLREVFERDGSEIVAEGLRRIAEFYRVESGIRVRPAEERLAVRQARTAPLVEDFGLWLRDCRARVSARSRLGERAPRAS